EVGEGVHGEERVAVADRRHVEAVENPQHAHEPEGAEAHHHHAHDALGLHQTAVEEGHAGPHQQHECRRRDRPGEVAAVHGCYLSRCVGPPDVHPAVLGYAASLGASRFGDARVGFHGCYGARAHVNITFRAAVG